MYALYREVLCWNAEIIQYEEILTHSDQLLQIP